MIDWRDVWMRKAKSHQGDDYSLARLIALDGFDNSCSAVTVDDFRAFADRLIEKLALRPGDSVLEVGCGAGAMCKALHERGLKVAGVDYTPGLVEICRRAIPDGTFLVAEGATFEMEKKDFDAVISHSVFHYFPSEEYALRTFRRMVEHTRDGGFIALTDMHDIRKKEEHERRRKEMLGEEEYNRLYKEVSHTYYDPSIFQRVADEICSEHWVEDQFLKSESGKFKFNFYARK